MADKPKYSLSYYGWMDEYGNRHNWPKSFASGRRPSLDQTYGVFVKLTNVDDPEDVEMFWVYSYPDEMENWADWLALAIAIAVSNYGYDLAE